MSNELMFTPDWITIVIQNRKDLVFFEESKTMWPMIHDLIIPTLEIKTRFRFFNGTALWQSEGVNIYHQAESTYLTFTGEGCMDDYSLKIEKLLKSFNLFGIKYKISRIDYQATFRTNKSNKLFKEFRKVKSSMKKMIIEKDSPETVSMSNSSVKILLYQKSLQLKEVKKKSFRRYKEKFIKKFGNIEDLTRLEISLKSKNALLKKINQEITETMIIEKKSLSFLEQFTKKYKFSDAFKKLIKNMEVI